LFISIQPFAVVIVGGRLVPAPAAPRYDALLLAPLG
jgi:hypothetical protein